MSEKQGPTVEATLTWSGDLRFAARAGGVELTMDGEARTGVSPVQALALALLGCMSTDIAHILTKARQPLRGLEGRFFGVRAPEDPRRFVKIHLQFRVDGAVPPDRVERAIALSRETYCSVWHSLRRDIELVTSFELTATP